MRWYLLAAVIFGLSITDVASQAQGPPGDRRLSLSRSTPQDAGFFATSGVVRFQIVHGRLCLDPPRHRKGSQSRDSDGVYESITVTAERGIPSLHYVYQTPQQHLTLSVQKAGHVRIESYLPKTSERSILDQPEIGSVSWSLSRGDLNDEHRGATLLHVRQGDPSGFDLHYGRLIERLLRGQSVGKIADDTQAKLLLHANLVSVPDAESIRQSIRQLRSSRRTKRMEAQHRLLSWGTPIVPIIHAMNPDDLDQEQRDRLRQVLRRLRRPVNDTPASLAMLLINDHQYWSLIAPRLTNDQVQLANHHLTRAGLDTIMLQSRPAARIAVASE